ncbi:uncharacterized protein LOC143244416 isoform X3 [Tachypleus tridentatus]|uniref:uncharacterized protein LOC143244416 isoform X3 n=1 Tax=Tachypleus tridentatus TaxID=6853 RepID=UPI003FD1317F
MYFSNNPVSRKDHLSRRDTRRARVDLNSCLSRNLLWSTMSSPKKEDLPAVPSAMKDELASFNSSHLKHAETQEKQCLPSKEDIKQEKIHQEMIEGVENFNRSALKQTNTEEKIVLPTKEEIILEKGQQELLKNIQSYNPSNLRPTETVEKNPLPTKDVIDLEKSAA